MFLDPTRGHPRQHHPQRHEAGADRVERAGLRSPNEGQKVQYEIESGRDGRTSAGNISYL